MTRQPFIFPVIYCIQVYSLPSPSLYNFANSKLWIKKDDWRYQNVVIFKFARSQRERLHCFRNYQSWFKFNPAAENHFNFLGSREEDFKDASSMHFKLFHMLIANVQWVAIIVEPIYKQGLCNLTTFKLRKFSEWQRFIQWVVLLCNSTADTCSQILHQLNIIFSIQSIPSNTHDDLHLYVGNQGCSEFRDWTDVGNFLHNKS